MNFEPLNIKAKTISDAWFQLIYNVLPDQGFTYNQNIQKGSFENETYRYQFPGVSIYIEFPDIDMVPVLPEGLPVPTTQQYILDYFVDYLMRTELKEEEVYTYGSRINRPIMGAYTQLDTVINTLKATPLTNQAILEIALPEDSLKADPPCLRLITFNVIPKDDELVLTTSVFFRSWDLWCISDDSDILTNNGWKNINNIDKKDLCASWDINSNEIDFVLIDEILKFDYNGKMYKLNNKRVDQLVTPNHRILFKQVTHSGSKRVIKNWGYKLAKDIEVKDGIIIPLGSEFNGGNESVGGVDKASLLGWVLTDAHYVKNYNGIEIYQTVSKYADEIRKLLKKLDIKFSEHVRKHNNPKHSDLCTFKINAKDGKWIRNELPDRLPVEKLLWLNKEERRALFFSMIKADGSIKYGRNGTISYAFYSRKKETIEWFQRLSLSLGFNAIVGNRGNLQISNKEETILQKIHFDGKFLPQEDYIGKVWCVTNKNKNFIMRRNNKISITGNSALPTNLGGIEMLKQLVASEAGLKNGPMYAYSSGLHIYGYHEEVVKLRLKRK